MGCFAHARRKFIEAQRLQVKGKTGKADWAVNHISKLYRIESEIKNKSLSDRHVIRRQQARPLLNQFKTWLNKSAQQVPPKSAVGKTAWLSWALTAAKTTQEPFGYQPIEVKSGLAQPVTPTTPLVKLAVVPDSNWNSCYPGTSTNPNYRPRRSQC
ncbi:MAG: hypothetical protein ACI8P9_003135 [Parasphingorhabdus sp.]